jgi:protein disulfide-isomerase
MVAAFADLNWETDFDKAMKQAGKSGMLMLVDFSGSDWCGWCKRLDKEVFAEKEFKKFIDGKFVPVLIDTPRKKLPYKLRKQNDELKTKYGIKGFPTVLIMNAKGKVLEKTGYMRGGAKNYIKYLQRVYDKNVKK